jgi:hypothetical protein
MPNDSTRRQLKTLAATLRDAQLALTEIPDHDVAVNFPALIGWLAADLPVVLEKLAKLFDIIVSGPSELP